MERTTLNRELQGRSDPVIYCVVPPRLAAIQPRLCEHFAGDSDVEVVIDQRVAERRANLQSDADDMPVDELAGRLTPGIERRTIDGRRTAVPVAQRAALPPELRRYEQDLTFLAGPQWSSVADAEGDDFWEPRCMEAEQQAVKLARALIAATEALRSRGGLSPVRFRELARAELALERYNRWCTSSERQPF